MHHVITRIIDVRTSDPASPAKFEGTDADRIKSAEKIEVQVTPVGENAAILVIICEEDEY